MCLTIETKKGCDKEMGLKIWIFRTENKEKGEKKKTGKVLVSRGQPFVNSSNHSG